MTKSKDFIKLQKQWYKKLKDSGFDDIEFTDHATGLGQNSAYLKRPSAYLAKKYNKQTDKYYSLFRNFLTFGTFTSKIDKNIALWHSEGVSYRKIVKLIAKTHRMRRSLFYVFTKIKKLQRQMIEFNRTHPEGMLQSTYEGSED